MRLRYLLAITSFLAIADANYACTSGVKACGSQMNTVNCYNERCVACADGRCTTLNTCPQGNCKCEDFTPCVIPVPIRSAGGNGAIPASGGNGTPNGPSCVKVANFPPWVRALYGC